MCHQGFSLAIKFADNGVFLLINVNVNYLLHSVPYSRESHENYSLYTCYSNLDDFLGSGWSRLLQLLRGCEWYTWALVVGGGGGVRSRVSKFLLCFILIFYGVLPVFLTRLFRLEFNKERLETVLLNETIEFTQGHGLTQELLTS